MVYSTHESFRRHAGLQRRIHGLPRTGKPAGAELSVDGNHRRQRRLYRWDAGDPASYPGGTTLKDTANHYDGTFVNNGSGGDVSFDSANGGSLVFDGSDDYVNITTLPDYSGTARSAIIWFNVDGHRIKTFNK